MKAVAMAWGVSLPGIALLLLAGVGSGALGEHGWLMQWQSLVGSLVSTAAAIVAALIGGRYILQQARLEQDRAEADRQRRLIAARAALPLSLSTMSDYARRSAATLSIVRSLETGGALPAGHPSAAAIPDSLPNKLVEQLVGVIEVAEGTPRAALIKLVRELQIQHARMVDAKVGLSGPHTDVSPENVDQYVLDAASIYARTAALFDYARSDEENTPVRVVDTAAVVSALNQCGVREWEFPAIHARARRGEH